MIQIVSALVLCVLILFSAPLPAGAWGGRAHDTICEAAVHLVEDATLRVFLKHRSHTTGHLCNVPDIYWKTLSQDLMKYGSPAHYIDIEMLGMKPEEVPLDFAKILRDFDGKPDAFAPGEMITDIPATLGTLWWRVDQFMRRIAAMKPAFSGVKPPQGWDEEQNYDLPYNLAVYDFFVNAGLMGHFVGDASMPYHSSNDHDGWKAGHGGIHAYYEEMVVAEFDGDLPALVLKKARALKARSPGFLKGSVLERMRKLSVISLAEMAEVSRRDPVLEKSQLVKGEGRKEKKTPAMRLPPAVGLKVFREMILTDMGRSAVLLAKLWDEAYVSVGKPDLSKYRSYRYPFTPEFIPPDYLSGTPEK